MDKHLSWFTKMCTVNFAAGKDGKNPNAEYQGEPVQDPECHRLQGEMDTNEVRSFIKTDHSRYMQKHL